jgi:hypothetical protein
MLDINPTIYLQDLVEQTSVKGVKAEDLIPRKWKHSREQIATEYYLRDNKLITELHR